MAYHYKLSWISLPLNIANRLQWLQTNNITLLSETNTYTLQPIQARCNVNIDFFGFLHSPSLFPGPSPLPKWRSGRRNRWTRLPKYCRNRGVFFHVTHDEIVFSEVVFSDWQPCLFYGNLKPLLKRNEDILAALVFTLFPTF